MKRGEGRREGRREKGEGRREGRMKAAVAVSQFADSYFEGEEGDSTGETKLEEGYSKGRLR